MDPIEPQIVDIDSYLEWRHSAGQFLEELMHSRDSAVGLLCHTDPVVRRAAVRSFVYIWHVDLAVARRFVTLANEDADSFVRYRAADTLILMHMRSSNRNTQNLFEIMLNEIARCSNQLPEISDDVSRYLEIIV
jgi:hypothetical protein